MDSVTLTSLEGRGMYMYGHWSLISLGGLRNGLLFYVNIPLLVFQLLESHLTNMVPDEGCDTVCNGLGCVCSNPIGADTVTIVISEDNKKGDTRHCLCGDFQVKLFLRKKVDKVC